MKMVQIQVALLAVLLSYNVASAQSQVQVEEKAVVDQMMESGQLSEVEEEISPYEKFKKRYKRRVRTQKQPTTYVEASPLEESQAERLRRARQDAEISTERKIVEKLEAARLADEKRRAEKLFGNKLNDLSSQNQAVQNQPMMPVQQPVQQAPMVQMVPAAAAPQESNYEKDNEAIKEELISAVRAEIKASQEEVAEEPVEDRYYISGLVGSSEYPNAPDVKSNSSIGLMVGVESGDNLTIEGGFIYSGYYLDQTYYSYKELNQYNFTVGVKYAFLKGKVRPTVGALVSYTTRSYNTVSNYQNFIQNKEETSAFDVGFGAGVDLAVSEGFSVGVDLRYLTNLTNKTSANFRRYAYLDDYKVEEYDYYVFNIMGKIHF